MGECEIGGKTTGSCQKLRARQLVLTHERSMQVRALGAGEGMASVWRQRTTTGPHGLVAQGKRLRSVWLGGWVGPGQRGLVGPGRMV